MLSTPLYAQVDTKEIYLVLYSPTSEFVTATSDTIFVCHRDFVCHTFPTPTPHLMLRPGHSQVIFGQGQPPIESPLTNTSLTGETGRALMT